MPKKTPLMPSRRSFLAGLLGAGMTSLVLPSPLLASKVQSYQQSALFMGTIVRIDIAHTSQAQAEAAVAKAFAKGKELESLLTRFDSTSPLGVLNSQGSLQDVPPAVREVLTQSAFVHSLSAGRFDPSILPVLQALEQDKTLSQQQRNALFQRVNFSKVERNSTIRLSQDMALTLDGIAKGYIAQAMSKELSASGCPNHLVNAGGDILANGSSAQGPWRVAVQSPFGSRYPSVLSLNNMALATSGVYEPGHVARYGNHLVIPMSMQPSEVVSASVLAKDGMLADALATAFSVMPIGDVLKTCRDCQGVEALLMLRNGSLVHSQGWPA